MALKNLTSISGNKILLHQFNNKVFEFEDCGAKLKALFFYSFDSSATV